jgi:hypothetical protein
MATVVWKTTDSWENKQVIWSGAVGNMHQIARLFADTNFVYVGTWRISRTTVSGGNVDDISPDITTSSVNSNTMISNFLTDYGLSLATAGIVNFYTQDRMDIYTSYYPETQNSWALASGVPNELGIDVVFPEIPESPRFLIGLSGISNQKVLIATTGSGIDALLVAIYPTNWTAMISGAIVTDLEEVRII